MFSHVWLFVTLQIVAHQAPLSMEFLRQRYWTGFPFSTPEGLLNPGTEPVFPCICLVRRQADCLLLHHMGGKDYIIDDN